MVMTSVGLPAIAYVLPEQRVTLEQLAEQAQLTGGASRLRALGFEYVHVSDVEAVELAVRAVHALAASQPFDPESVDALFYAGALPSSHAVALNGGLLDGFSYPAARVQYEVGLLNAEVTGVSQAGCVGLMRAVQLAADFLVTHPRAERALAVSADVLPRNAGREILYNVISDGACAVLVERNASRNKLLGYRNVTKGYYWDVKARDAEIVAAYFPTARTIVRETLEAAGVHPNDIAWVIPQNVSRRSWEILLELIELPSAQLYSDNIASKGHVIAADNFINLSDAAVQGRLRPGDRLLLFNFGFGANWSCVLLEH
jgi:3-oxoacyl-[acyl-carrier-protein] synthase-3